MLSELNNDVMEIREMFVDGNQNNMFFNNNNCKNNQTNYNQNNELSAGNDYIDNNEAFIAQNTYFIEQPTDQFEPNMNNNKCGVHPNVSFVVVSKFSCVFKKKTTFSAKRHTVQS